MVWLWDLACIYKQLLLVVLANCDNCGCKYDVYGGYGVEEIEFVDINMYMWMYWEYENCWNEKRGFCKFFQKVGF